MRVLITGANGFIGRHLIQYFQQKNLAVVALCRSGKHQFDNVRVFRWQLGEKIPKAALEGITHAIHLAHDFDGEQGAEKTLTATERDCIFLQSCGVQRQLFFSSYSAGEYATSLYGSTKYKIEKAVKPVQGVVIVRPGLVLGDSGIYGRMRRMARGFFLLPLPDGGKGVVPVIDIQKLCEQTHRVLCDYGLNDENLFESELISLRDLILNEAKQSNHKLTILNVPSKIILFVLNVSAWLRLPLPVNADNLRGFLANQESNHQSTLRD